MSGRKEVTISTAEYNRLREQAARATTLSQANAALNRINDGLTSSVSSAQGRIDTLTNNLDRMNQTMRRNQQAADTQISDLRRQLENQVESSNRKLEALNQQNAESLRQLQSNMNNAVASLADTIATNNRNIEDAMNRNNEILTGQINNTNQRIDVLNDQLANIHNQVANLNDAVATTAQQQADLQQMARDYLDMARQLNADSQNYRCELLLPGALKPVLNREAFAQGQLNLPGNGSAAQMAAQQAYQAALAFHEQIVQAEQAWILRHQAAMQAVEGARARISNSGTVVEEATKKPVDVDHWSDGQLSCLSRDADALLEQLTNEDTSSGLSLTDLEGICSRGTQIGQDTLETSAFALGAAVNSQIRVIIANRLERNLFDSNALRRVGRGYQGGDQRSSYRTHLQDANGLSLVVTQTPVAKPDGGLDNRLEVEIANPGTYNEATANALIDDIRRTLRASGVDVSTLTTVPGYESIHSGREQVADMEQWRQETATVARPRNITTTTQNTRTNQTTQTSH